MNNFLAKLKMAEQVTIVALGDSNTELTFHTAGRLPWLGLLQEALFDKYGRNRVITINGACAGTGAAQGIEHLERNALRFAPDLVIISYGMAEGFHGEAGVEPFKAVMRRMVGIIRERCGSDILLRTPNPIVVPNQPALPQGHVPGDEWPGFAQDLAARAIVELAEELGCAVVDHYTLWTCAARPPGLAEEPNHLWMRMSDAVHPNGLGHLYFYRELAPVFGLPQRLPWEAGWNDA